MKKKGAIGVFDSGYGGLTILESLRNSGFDPKLLILEAGEDQKNPASISLIHDAAYSAKLERGSLMIALGGGVVGDKIVFVKCFQDTTQAPGAIMRDDGFSLTLSNIPCHIFPRLREHQHKQMGTTIILLNKTLKSI